MQSCRAEPQLGLVMIRDSSRSATVHARCGSHHPLLTHQVRVQFMELARKEACNLESLFSTFGNEVLTKPLLSKSALSSSTFWGNIK